MVEQVEVQRLRELLAASEKKVQSLTDEVIVLSVDKASLMARIKCLLEENAILAKAVVRVPVEGSI